MQEGSWGTFKFFLSVGENVKLSKLVLVVQELVIWALLSSGVEAARLTAAALTDSSVEPPSMLAGRRRMFSLRNRESGTSAGAVNLSPPLKRVSLRGLTCLCLDDWNIELQLDCAHVERTTEPSGSPGALVIIEH